MALPINIEDLIDGDVIESQRIDYKEGLNDERVLHTMCAFANDFRNEGGGYIVIGIEDDNGFPVLPPKGLNRSQVDTFQKKIFQLSNYIEPSYSVDIQPFKLDGKWILVIYCSAGDGRPYDAPVSLAKGNRVRKPYIRIGSNTKEVKTPRERQQLDEISKRISFDDRRNHSASLHDISLELMQQYLESISSQLLDLPGMRQSKERLLQSLDLIAGPVEDRKPKNVALMMFCISPEKFFPAQKATIVTFSDNTGISFVENTFTGPADSIIRNLIKYFQQNIQVSSTTKNDDQASASIYHNYPLLAFREAVANAIYHMSYEQEQGVEIRVFPDRIEVISYPAALPSITNDLLRDLRITGRFYRNRRLGEFLKSLGLTEKRATGLPSIADNLTRNGSPSAVFYTDEIGGLFFQTTIYIHPDFENIATIAPGIGPARKLDTLEKRILKICSFHPVTIGVIALNTGFNRADIEVVVESLMFEGMLQSSRLKVPVINVYMTTEEGLRSLDM